MDVTCHSVVLEGSREELRKVTGTSPQSTGDGIAMSALPTSREPFSQKHTEETSKGHLAPLTWQRVPGPVGFFRSGARRPPTSACVPFSESRSFQRWPGN